MNEADNYQYDKSKRLGLGMQNTLRTSQFFLSILYFFQYKSDIRINAQILVC